ncbi:MAG: phosphohistidine phosphatase SixA [Bacteroidota bacterium]
MDLFILRHAIAVERGTPGYEKDSDRPLTEKGEKKMYEIAEGMRALKIKPDLILSSPFARARRTAEIAAEVLRCKKRLVFSDTLATTAEPKDVINELMTHYADRESIMLVGHEPYLSDLISTLTTDDGDLSVTMKKGGLCKLTVGTLVDGRCATLECLLTPRNLTQIR